MTEYEANEVEVKSYYKDDSTEVLVDPGEYEVTGYSVDGPAHSRDFVKVDTRIVGLHVSSVERNNNVIVKRDGDIEIVINVPPNRLWRRF